MQIKLTELNNLLLKSVSPLYLITGDEPLLIEQAQNLIRSSYQQKGFHYRELVSIEKSANWDELYTHFASTDLFAEKKIIDIRNPNNKFDSKAQRFFDHINNAPNEDTLLIISSAKISAATKRTKWFKKLEKNSVIINIWPIPSYELPKWIAQQLKQAHINASHDSIQLLADLSEGNLLATQQGITKLKLLFPNERITPDHVCQAIHDTARYNVFDLSNYALLGSAEKTTRALQQLQQSNVEPTLILWALSREIRLLHGLLHAKHHGSDTQTLLRSEWQSRQRLLSSATKRLRLDDLSALLQLACKADKIIKGNQNGNIWLTLNQLCLGLCGVNSHCIGDTQ